MAPSIAEASSQRRPSSIWLLVAALAATASACAGSGGSDDPTTTSASTSATTGMSTTDATGSSSTSESSEGSTGADTDCLEVEWYLDSDGDGRGDASMSTMACDPPPGYVGPGDDCDDTDESVHPLADELCDGKDNDCDSLLDEGSPQNASCNGCNTVEEAGRAYYFCTTAQAWDAARTQCNDLFAADLIKIDDAAENDFLVASEAGGAGAWFIGLSDRTTEGTFVWIDDSALEFIGWNDGEPNDAGGIEDCAEMSLETGGWNDIPCDMTRPFICEAPLP